MFFIFGSPRSGTTLLAQCLSAHSKVVVPHETDFIVPLALVFDRIKDAAVGREMIFHLVTQSPLSSSVLEFLSAQEVRDVIFSTEYRPAAILEALYDGIARKAGKQLAGDKSPNDLMFLRILIKTGVCHPGVKILHIVRDVRDMMASLQTLKWVGDLDLYFPRIWCSDNLYLHSVFHTNSANYLLIRYEDFVRQPEQHLQKACEFLGFCFEPEMLSPLNRHERYKKMGHHTNLFAPISDSRIGVYRESLQPDQIRNCEQQAREALERFRYMDTRQQ